MAKKKDSKKAVKKAQPVKPVKKAVKSAAKPAPSKGKAGSAAKKTNKPAAGKSAKSTRAEAPSKKPVSKMSKPAPKPTNTKKKEEPKKASKPVSKVPAKPAPKTAVKAAVKAPKKPAGKPIDAVAVKGKGKAAAKKASGKIGKKGSEDEEEDLPAEEEEEEGDAEVKDDYEKTEEEDAPIAEGPLDDPGIIDLEGPGPSEIDEDDDEIPEKRGRGRRKKNEGKSSGGTMEAYIRNRPLQIDISKPLIKKGNVVAPKPFINTDDKRTRYSDKELAEFKELILEKLKEAQMDYDLLKQTLSNEDNHGTDDTSPSFKLLEDGSDVMSKEETAQLASRQEKYIVSLKNALVRIENKAYGICRVTGKLIPKERLRSVPHATLGIDAKLNQS
jgi:DnaK suppressor protein